MSHPHSIIKRIFESQVPISADAAEQLLSSWTKETVLKRNEYLIQQGEIETQLFYVVDGAMRIYYPREDEEICVGFAYTGNLICAYPSFIHQKPSDYYIQALGKTTDISISRERFYGLFDRFREIETCWRMLEEEALLGKIEREVEMLTFTPEERYARLLQRSPHIFQLIPRKYIASYLRMTPETLSRLKPA